MPQDGYNNPPNSGAHPSRPRPFEPPPALPGGEYDRSTQQAWPTIAPSCPPIGAPYPCSVYMDPNRPGKVYGCGMPYDKIGCRNLEEAVKMLCWVETTLRSEEPVDAGEFIEFEFEIKWWSQWQEVVNFGDQVNRTFDLVEIRYGQSNYALEIEELKINGVGVPQNGIDIRRWNQTNFQPKKDPVPAAALNDPVRLKFKNTSADPQDMELGFGGPAVLQIG